MSEFSSKNFADLYIVFILVRHLLFLSTLSIFRLKFCSTHPICGSSFKTPSSWESWLFMWRWRAKCRELVPGMRAPCLYCPASCRMEAHTWVFLQCPGNVPKPALMCDGWAEPGFHPRLYQPAEL